MLPRRFKHLSCPLALSCENQRVGIGGPVVAPFRAQGNRGFEETQTLRGPLQLDDENPEVMVHLRMVRLGLEDGAIELFRFRELLCSMVDHRYLQVDIGTHCFPFWRARTVVRRS
jgi:hypothetical protein